MSPTKKEQEPCLPHEAWTSVCFLHLLLHLKGKGMEAHSTGVQKEAWAGLEEHLAVGSGR